MDTVSLWHMCVLAKYVVGISLGLCACVYIRKISKGFALWEEVAVTDRTQAVPPRGWPRWQHLAVPIKNSCCWASGAKESPRCPQVHLKADFLTVYCLALPVPVNFTRRCFTSSERESEGGGGDRRKRKTFIDFYATTTLIVPKWKALFANLPRLTNPNLSIFLAHLSAFTRQVSATKRQLAQKSHGHAPTSLLPRL